MSDDDLQEDIDEFEDENEEIKEDKLRRMQSTKEFDTYHYVMKFKTKDEKIIENVRNALIFKNFKCHVFNPPEKAKEVKIHSSHPLLSPPPIQAPPS